MHFHGDVRRDHWCEIEGHFCEDTKEEKIDQQSHRVENERVNLHSSGKSRSNVEDKLASLHPGDHTSRVKVVENWHLHSLFRLFALVHFK